jgi:hypothetical protein
MFVGAPKWLGGSPRELEPHAHGHGKALANPSNNDRTPSSPK